MLNAREPQPARLLNKPLYLQLRDALAHRISSGEWKPNTAIPNESDLARQFGVSAGTMRKALDLMESDRLLTRRQGRGTFVNDQASDEFALRYANLRGSDGRRLSGEVQAAEIVEANADEVEGLRLSLGARDRVFRIKRMRVANKRPFMLENVTLPADLFPGLAAKKLLGERIIGLAQHYGLLLGKAEERVSIAAAAPNIAGALGIAPSSATLLLDRVVFALDGRALEWRVGYCCVNGGYYLAQMC